MSAHTPGPWVRQSRNVYDGIGRILAQAEWPHVPGEHIDPTTAPEVAANARLIAAAPELLEALRMVRDADEDCRLDGLPCIPDAARAKIDAAIAKAEGKP